MAAGIIALCDQVAALIKAEWEPGLPNEVQRLYEAPVTISELSSLVGRKVYVFPTNKLTVGAASRGEDSLTWTVGVLCIERYVDAAIVPAAWMDALVEWVENVVEFAVDFDGREEANYLIFDSRTLWTRSIETDIYDVDALGENKLFWSAIVLTFEEVAEV
jgi:hypothetical protein